MSETDRLINGAWHGGWAWRPVAEHLRAAGHRVLTPTLPGLADGDDPASVHLSDVVDFIVDLVESEDLTDVTVVAHSWGGYPMTGAAPRIASRLKSLVYWSAFVPADGKCLMDEVPPPFVELFQQLADAAGGQSVMLPFEVWQEGFMNGAGEDVQRLVHQLLVPQPLSFFTETVPALDTAAVGAKVRYIFSEDDVALPPGEYGWVPRFPARLGVEPETAPGGHEACFTHPEGLAEAIMAG